mmetsp:Transcript_31468/g.66560  ORF Transcript_31468/g.66560 Transcript_31468/m.66560 type:complete len:200 (+) Transcript_31468:843-1442(+)
MAPHLFSLFQQEVILPIQLEQVQTGQHPLLEIPQGAIVSKRSTVQKQANRSLCQGGLGCTALEQRFQGFIRRRVFTGICKKRAARDAREGLNSQIDCTATKKALLESQPMIPIFIPLRDILDLCRPPPERLGRCTHRLQAAGGLLQQRLKLLGCSHGTEQPLCGSSRNGFSRNMASLGHFLTQSFCALCHGGKTLPEPR